MMAETFTVQQDLKLNEFLNAVYYISSKSKSIRKLILFSVIVSCVGVILNLFTDNSITYKMILSNLSAPVFVFIIFCMFIGLAAILLMIFKPNNFKNITYTFTHWGMEKTGKGISFSTQWSKFLHYKETKHFIFLFITESDAHIIQKRMFSTEAEVKEFVTFLDERFKHRLL